MKVTIQKAKNGEDTALIDGHFLHSNYAPVKEAERFVENLTLPYSASSIIIIEPGLSYTSDLLRKKFPDIKIGAVRYTDAFKSYDSNFDFVLNFYEQDNFEVYLESKLNEEELLTSVFISWPASVQIFIEYEKQIWPAIKASIERAKTLLITRQYFEKKWLLNSCNFLKYHNKILTLNSPINKDAVIISSGPSLIPFLKTLKENQDKFFIICLSSAISVCLENNIIPDICMTTDGGYWAGEHLKPLYKTKLPVAMPLEAYCPKSLLSKLDIIPLNYGDGISNELIEEEKLIANKAVRNGTVSGTALLFAANYCTKNIYLSGLDMACQTGYQHAQPNQLEFNSSLRDNRINTKATRLTRSELTNGSLDIYKNWFINNPLNMPGRKVFRLMEEKYKKNSLDWIHDIDLNSFAKMIPASSGAKEKTVYDIQENNHIIKSVLLFSDKIKSDTWRKNLFPLDFVQLSHNPKNTEIKTKIEYEWEKLKTQIEDILS